MILISACLMGSFCRFDGGTNLISDIDPYQNNFIPCCPEQLGGLATPRPAAEIVGGDAYDVLNGRAKIVTVDGNDVTEAFVLGANKTLALAKKHHVKIAILKENSPSCGSSHIYDGSFTGQKITGVGLTTALLQTNGIDVYSEKNFPQSLIK